MGLLYVTPNENAHSVYAIEPASMTIAMASPSPACASNALCPSMLDNAYGFASLQSSGITGQGQTVVIDDACGDPSIASDLSTFDAQFGLSNPKLSIIYPEGTNGLCVDSSWSLETTIDVEIAHVVAPGAAIDLLIANNASAPDVYQNWAYAISHNLGYQISNSFGGAGCYTDCNNTIGQGIGPCTLTNGTQGFNVNKLLSKAESKHITMLVAAGDSGAWGLGTSGEEPVPGDCQGVLTVGGTELDVSSTGQYVGESAWSNGGGGYVTTPAEPKFESNAGILDPYGTLAKPDVSADASSSTGPWIYNSGYGGWVVVGGTSVACPIWAGFMALVNQIRASNDLRPAGFINEFLYKTVYGVNGTSPMYNEDFHDVSSGSNGWPAGTGWSAATGLGSPIAPALAETLGTNSLA